MTQRRGVGSKINKRKINKLETSRKEMQKSSLVRVDKIKHYGVRQVLATTWTRIVWPGSMISGQQQFFRPQELVRGTTSAEMDCCWICFSCGSNYAKSLVKVEL